MRYFECLLTPSSEIMNSFYQIDLNIVIWHLQNMLFSALRDNLWILFCCRTIRGEDKVCGEIPTRNPTVQKLQWSPGGSSVFTGMGSGSKTFSVLMCFTTVFWYGFISLVSCKFKIKHCCNKIILPVAFISKKISREARQISLSYLSNFNRKMFIDIFGNSKNQDAARMTDLIN